MTWTELQGEIATGRPVIVWVIGAVWNGTGQIYTTLAGKQVTVAAFEHTMLMTGYDPNSVTLINAGTGESAVYPLKDFLTSWSVLGNMAVIADGKFEPGQPLSATPTLTPIDPTSTQTPGEPATAQPANETETQPPLGFITMTPTPSALDPSLSPTIQPTASLVPISTMGATPPVPEMTTPSEAISPGTYIVQQGDSLYELAMRWNMTWQDLARLNNVPPPYTLYAGQVLQMPAEVPPRLPASAPSETVTPISLATPIAPQETSTFIPITPLAASSLAQPLIESTITPVASTAISSVVTSGGLYTVQAGDYLARLAREWGTPWQDIATLNDIPFPFQLYPGQVLKIPAKR
jgi:LysM repeat protein